VALSTDRGGRDSANFVGRRPEANPPAFEDGMDTRVFGNLQAAS